MWGGCKVAEKDSLISFDGVVSPTDSVAHQQVKCKCAEDVVNCIDTNLNEISNPALHDFLHSNDMSYVIVTCQLQERGWKLDPATRTMRKVEASI